MNSISQTSRYEISDIDILSRFLLSAIIFLQFEECQNPDQFHYPIQIKVKTPGLLLGVEDFEQKCSFADIII